MNSGVVGMNTARLQSPKYFPQNDDTCAEGCASPLTLYHPAKWHYVWFRSWYYFLSTLLLRKPSRVKPPVPVLFYNGLIAASFQVCSRDCTLLNDDHFTQGPSIRQLLFLLPLLSALDLLHANILKRALRFCTRFLRVWAQDVLF